MVIMEVTSTSQTNQNKIDITMSGLAMGHEDHGQDESGSSVDSSESYGTTVDGMDDGINNEDSTEEHDSANDGTKSSSPMTEMQKFAVMEDKLVYRWRRIVIGSILLVGAIVGGFTYITINNEQISDSTEAFTLFANSIDDAFQFHIKTIFDAKRRLSREITTSAKHVNGQFPYFVVPSFEAKAFEVRKQAGIDTIIYAPIVTNENSWINFTQNTRDWLDESKLLFDILEPGQNRSLEPKTPMLPPTIWSYNQQDKSLEQRSGRGNFVPSYQISPPPIDSDEVFFNIDLLSDPVYKSISLASVALKDAVFSKFDGAYAEYVSKVTGEEEEEHGNHPHSIAAQPVYNKLDSSTRKIVGYLFSIISWEFYLAELLPNGVDGIYIVLRNSCNQSATYQLFGNEAKFVSENDVHDRSYNSQRLTIDFASNYFDPAQTSNVDGHCQVFLDVYPSDLFTNSYKSNLPIIFTVLIVFLFISMAAIFSTYDRFVQARNTKVVGAAERTSAIVSSLFPEAVRERLMEQQNDDAKSRNLKGFLAADKSELSNVNRSQLFQTKPIADLFPETTIIFADIVNFTAWSSVRDPSQVFTLLETVYNAFDDIARKRRIFKVETIGDCYVAVCGLPEPAKDHALRMARFARDSMHKMWIIVKNLESTLGPDTGDLTMRMGIHSGPVTAGVLRGERSRFQLFGDTMNTAARMETTGFPDCIQISQTTADLLIAAGKLGWVKPRSDMVNAKGKGLMQTYFLEVNKKASSEASSGDDSIVDSTDYSDGMMELTETAVHTLDVALPTTITSKNGRLVEWMAEVLMGFIKEIATRRNGSKRNNEKSSDDLMLKNLECHVIDEVKEIISLPGKRSSDAKNETFNPIVEIDPKVGEQLRHYLARIAAMYPENSFHNFEHVAHVTMSVQKVLARIIAPSDLDRAYEIKSLGADNTYGITSDPLTQFSCVFSAVIHDVDHPGVPNTVLVAEKTELADKYHNKSIAEQNSVDLAWNLLMGPKYHALRSAIYSNEEEMKRFRQLVVNSVMATDIADKDQKVFRNARWDRAFHENVTENEQDSINRKATIVIEHLIQASDVSHTMQHWHIYRKWNQRFFEECYKAYKTGRSDSDPSLNWYQGEIGFFDFYIIPLAKKLKECGVFGVSSDEYLNYAMQNRNEWKDRGQGIVLEMIECVRTKDYSKINNATDGQCGGDAVAQRPMKKFSSKTASTKQIANDEHTSELVSL